MNSKDIGRRGCFIVGVDVDSKRLLGLWVLESKVKQLGGNIVKVEETYKGYHVTAAFPVSAIERTVGGVAVALQVREVLCDDARRVERDAERPASSRDVFFESKRRYVAT